MNDQAYVAELQAILTNDAPQGIDPNDPYGQADDGIDRYDGFGRDVWVESLRVVEGDHGSELEVSFGLGVPADPAFAAVPRQGAIRLPFDPEWRRLSGYEEPAGYAPQVARRVEREAHTMVGRYRDGIDWAVAQQRVREQLPERGAQWRMLLEELAAEGSVSEPSPGRITVDVARDPASGDSGGQVTVLVTPDQWEEVLVEHGGEYGDVWEMFGSRSPDETFLVFYDGDLVWSIREELPPLHREAFAEMARRVAARSHRP